MSNASFSPELRSILLSVATASIENGFGEAQALPVDIQTFPEELRAFGNSFTTLYVRGKFQGCIGSMRPIAPLVIDVANNAFRSAFQDSRVAPIKTEDVQNLKIHISVLSQPEPIDFLSEDDLISKVRPGIDGLVVEENGRRGTLLPSVWEQLPDAGDFVRHVKAKAGLPSSYWSSSIRFLRYTTESFSN